MAAFAGFDLRRSEVGCLVLRLPREGPEAAEGRYGADLGALRGRSWCPPQPELLLQEGQPLG
eukprot:1055958-Alexandrium_andersonii.AAC.1